MRFCSSPIPAKSSEKDSTLYDEPTDKTQTLMLDVIRL